MYTRTEVTYTAKRLFEKGYRSTDKYAIKDEAFARYWGYWKAPDHLTEEQADRFAVSLTRALKRLERKQHNTEVCE